MARAGGVCFVLQCCGVSECSQPLYCAVITKLRFLTIDDKKLIEGIRKYPTIYDMSHPKYLDNNYKSSLWKKISEEMKEEGT
jgi:hypothetical protein